MAVSTPPRRLGRYELLERIAGGGMGAIYLGRLRGEHAFEKRVAVKTLRDHTADDERFRGMFLDEMRIASRIDHPQVCSVIDAGEEAGTLYMVMEYCDGLALSEIRDRIPHRLPHELYARVLADAARGLHAAHELHDEHGEPMGIVHRDVSPQNIMVLRRGGVKVLDFGIARARHRITRSHAGELKGKLAYISPEQLRRDPLDRRADVWAMGVVLWEACLGRHPFEGNNPAATLANIASQPIPDPSTVSGDLPETLAEVLRHALVRDPDRRTPTAWAFADGLERFLYESGRPFGIAQVAELVAPAFSSPPESEARPLEIATSDRDEPDGRGDLTDGRPAPDDTGPLWPDGAGIEAAGRITAELDGEEETVPSAAVPDEAWDASSTAATVPRATAADDSGAEERTSAPAGVAHATAGDAGGGVRSISVIRVTAAVALVAAAVLVVVVVSSWASPSERSTAADPAESPAGAAGANDTEETRVDAPRSDEDAPPGEMIFIIEEPDAAARGAAAPGARTTPSSPPPRAREPGFVSVIAVPNANVWLDGELLGETPLRRSVAPGRHRLRLETPDGRVETRSVTVTSAENARVSVAFE